MLRSTVALATFLVALCAHSVAVAYERRVAVLQPDPELFRALSLALGPWGLDTVSYDVPAPGPSQPVATQEATRLAGRFEAAVLVWITETDSAPLLWVFDATLSEVSSRALTERPPFDSASAAAVALSVKTILRASVVAPPDERFGYRSTEQRQRAFSVEAGVAGYWLGYGAIEPRGRLGAAFWFEAQPLGVALELSDGPGLRVETQDYAGRYRESTIGAGVRYALLDVAEWSTVIGADVTVHRAVLSGAPVAEGRSRNALRMNTSLDFGVAVNLHFAPAVYFGVSAQAAYFPKPRRYLLEGELLFEPSPLTGELSAHLGVELH